LKVGDLIRDYDGDLYLIVERYKVHNYNGPNKISKSMYCQSVKTGEIISLSENDVEVISESRRFNNNKTIF